MDVEDIDPHLCTHLVYTFFGLHQNGSIAVLDPWLDLEDNWGRANVRKFNELKKANPTMKTLAAVGGYNEGSETFSKVASDTDLRQRFAISARDFCVRHGFDGIDIGWEYPGQRGGDPAADKSNFVLLLAHVKQIFAAAGLMLTAALAASQNQAEISYDIPGLSQHLDFINLMTYNYNGGWDVVTGHNAPLFAGPADVTDFQQILNVHHSVMYWIRQGAPENKINLGIAFYGRTFTLSKVDKFGLRAAVKGPGIHGAYTQEEGFLAYYEICPYFSNEKWIRYWNKNQKIPFGVIGDQWIGYDDIESIGHKCNFTKQHNLAGLMAWSIEKDDFRGNCGSTKFPLLRALFDCIFTS
ncbi:brain chitinase and chia [Culex quinquefasciatus]|uniref:chitinase n=1 Tax=Culex quinquefasciatus TaxID=7176 RepID=B0WAN3_CULQU|nr:brain chitinase and chia [Culex quinquefasciatus]|eukprot:XP_001845767.1 brain chitinase and chia [Culex quinquefasciatus]